MSEKKWTPGPWIVEAGALDYPNIISEDCGEVVGNEGFYSERERDYHNANLMATAPELYEALEAAMDYINKSPCCPDTYPEQLEAWLRLQKALPHTTLSKARGGIHE